MFSHSSQIVLKGSAPRGRASHHLAHIQPHGLRIYEDHPLQNRHLFFLQHQQNSHARPRFKYRAIFVAAESGTSSRTGIRARLLGRLCFTSDIASRFPVMEQPRPSAVADFAHGAPTDSSPLSQSVRHDPAARIHEKFDAGQPGFTLVDGDGNQPELYRSGSMMSQSITLAPSRGGTLKKRQSLKKSGSIKRSSSRKSLGPGSVTSLAIGDREKYSGSQGNYELYSYTPVPTTGNPTDILADRFQGKSPSLSQFICDLPLLCIYSED